MSKSNTGAFIIGMVTGTVLGTMAGLLVSPRSSRQTKQFVKKSVEALPDLAEDLSTTMQIQADRISESALRNWDETLNRLQVAIAAGIRASQQERQSLKNPDISPQDSSLRASEY
ncbi:YtxH domain-containing protein [Merismopedia glauca]|uniref:Gas vesicle protein n=1 Tax=Merismopedia glauca CCAP 1448/3 TaxID=1296344 RepID=A0A2T1C5F7_9CYAN|nr:YtxH domain-containing protein [Merismopedia glauca]PSB03500.1 gas vesicle protein [Merismopedia glauca CCAP 1448/3]